MMRLSFVLTAFFTVLGCGIRVNGSDSTFWREQMEHNGRPAYLNSEDADLYSVWRDVRNSTYAGGVIGDGVVDDSVAIQAAINYGTGGVLWSRVNRAEQSTLPAYVYIPGGTYLIKNSLQLYVNTVIVGDPSNMPTLIADPSLGNNAIIYMYDANFGKSATTQFYQGVRNIHFDTTRVPMSTSGNAVNTPGSQACFLQNCKFTMTRGSQHIGVQMYGPDDTGGSGILLGDLTFYGGATGIRLNNQQYNFKNMAFDSVKTAIEVKHVFTAAFQGISFMSCGTGINATGADTSSSLSVIDSSCVNTPVCIKVATDLTFVIDGFINSNSSGASLYNVSSDSKVLAGSVEPGNVWLLGSTFSPLSANSSSSNSSFTNPSYTNSSYTNSSSSYSSSSNSSSSNSSSNSTTDGGTTVKVNRPSNLVDAHGKWFTKVQPQYQDMPISQFSNLKSDFGAVGDGKTDDTEAIQLALTTSATESKVLFVPQGTYLISSTVYVPPNSRIVGEVWSTFNAKGAYFSDASNPQPMLKVGNAGEMGIAHFSDVAFSVGDVLPGAILVEVNLAGEQQGDVGFWNSHFRIGGWVGAGDIRYKCQADDTSACKAVFMMLHLRTTSSVYIENMWGWTADHDIDGGPTMNIAAGRGMLVEAVNGTWLVGTSFEHNTLYQYQLAEASNVFVAMQQTETAYWQGPGSPNLAPDPWVSDANYHDPTFQDCTDGSLIVPQGFNSSLGNETKIEEWCQMGYAMRISDSKDIHIYNSGFWIFFNHWQPGNYSNAVTDVGQWRLGSVEDVEDLYWFNIDTKSTEYIVYDGVSEVTQDSSPGSWGGAVAGYLA